MKKVLLSAVSIIVVMFFMVSCNSGGKVSLKTQDDSVAYVIGANIGENLKRNITNDSLNFSTEALVQGFKDALEGIDSNIFTKEDKQNIMMNFQKQLQEKQNEKAMKAAEPNKIAGANFLQENKKQPGIIETSSGLQYKVVKAGTGKTPKATDNVTVNYEGKLISGEIFDSSYDRNKPETFNVSQVIRGWTEGLMLMKEGGSYELFIPSDLAYGDQGNAKIPGGSALIFKVELLKVEEEAATK
ncbi:MAG: FKBP-type peptidyl-prolyl cis-trans isomerase [Bacteroidales bacterium]|nr:FKBP-type peptidyl-prolyl cis-trans isomerase [Bacteroidales bacterium]MDD4213759.1 FKBP-type peptidyl-prolyl cis-trans isomerase [Bacteroidales bacterium]